MSLFEYTTYTPNATSTLISIRPGLIGKQQLLSAFAKAAAFPSYFGMNWDALYDCLVNLEHPESQEVIVEHLDLPALPEGDLRLYLGVLRDWATLWNRDPPPKARVVFPQTSRERIQLALRDDHT